jgi:hypothetical protein
VLSPSLPRPVGWAAGLLAVALGAGAVWWFTRPHNYEQAKAMGMTDEQTFTASRCLQVESWNDVGPNFLIELAGGECLFLGGQYIYDVEEGEAAGAGTPRRLFPATEFTVVRHRKQGFVYELRPAGAPLHPEGLKQYFLRVPGVSAPDDGAVFPPGSYDEFKRVLPDGDPANA